MEKDKSLNINLDCCLDIEEDVIENTFLKSAKTVIYCPTCGLPPEYCEFLPKKKFEKCKPWLSENCSDIYPHLKEELEQKRKRARRPKGQFVAWGQISSLYNVRITWKRNEIPFISGPLTYRGKIKLHGTNVAVTIQKKRRGKPLIYYQSRNKFITEEQDHHGFVKWAAPHSDYFLSLFQSGSNLMKFSTLTVFGEWCGTGIMKGAAICTIEKRYFAVFAIVLNKNKIIVDPKKINDILKGIWISSSSDSNTKEINRVEDKYKRKNRGEEEGKEEVKDNDDSTISIPKDMLVIPWITDDVILNFENEEHLLPVVEFINNLVEEIDSEDPWVKEKFGVSGTGEGVVWYPMYHDHSHNIENDKKKVVKDHSHHEWNIYRKLFFKTKGSSHRVVNQEKGVLLEPEIVENIEEFAEMFVTKPRLIQGWEELFGSGEVDIKCTQSFIEWISNDVKKESITELECNDLKWDQVRGAVRLLARKWFLQEINKIGGVVVERK